MKDKIFLRHYFLILIILIGFGLLDFLAAFAQTTTILAVSPAESELELGVGKTITIELWVSDAVDLNAFDITLTYDPATVQLVSWAYGNFLSNLFTVIEVNDPGNLRVAATQMSHPAVSGDGSLLTLTFSGLATGETPLTLSTVVFADLAGNQTSPDLASGQITVYPQRFTVSGWITLQGQINYEGIPVTLGTGVTHGYGPYNVFTNGDPTTNLVVPQVVEDTYQFTTQQPRYLNVHAGMNVQIIVDSDEVLPELNLKGGNAVWTDNVIDVSDASVVGAWYGKTLEDLVEGQTLDADVNFDGVVNIQDLAIVAGNYDLTSEIAYGAWLP